MKTQPLSPAPAKPDSFAAMFEESLARKEMRAGELITAQVVRIDHSMVVVNSGLKSESLIPLDEFRNSKGEMEVKAGDFVSVAIEALENGYGETQLSREKAKRLEAWHDLDLALEEGRIVEAVVGGKIKGGLTATVHGIPAFLPGSLVGARPVKDTTPYENRTLEVKIIKLDRKRNNVVVSHRAALEVNAEGKRETTLENIQEGADLKGAVKSITDYGAFVDLGGMDGLLHITDLAWRRVKHPSEILSVGDEVTVRVLKFDREKNRVSLGLKQLGDDPWHGLSRRHALGTRVFGRVTNLTDYGAFVEIEAGIEGLVHVSDMDWTRKNIQPSKIVSLGDEIEVMVLSIDEERRRMSLGMKQCGSNPWNDFATNHHVDERIKGLVKSITDFGVFIDLEGGIDGLIHLSDLSWSQSGEVSLHNYKKGDEVKAVILSIDVDRERVSLGIKQLAGDPFDGFASHHIKGDIVSGQVKSSETAGAVIVLEDGVEAYLKSSEQVNAEGASLKPGERIAAAISHLDRKNRSVQLSVKALSKAEVDAALQKLSTENKASSSTTNLGALLKSKMGEKDQDKGKPE